MQIYSSYDEEPEDIYHFLKPSLYSEFYDLEMGSFDKDLKFYSAALAESSEILEIGCGSGRLTRLLSNLGHTTTGIDLSSDMLNIAINRSQGVENYIQMDMRQLAFSSKFDAIIIPYNTLNLLTAIEDITSCLNGCRKHLNPEGFLLLHLYIPPANEEKHEQTKSFQFQMLDRPQSGKIVKEILRITNYSTNLMEMTERYKVRPMNDKENNINYSHTLHLNSMDRSSWLEIIESYGFTVQSCYTNFQLDNSASPDPGLLLVKAQCTRV